MFDFLSGTKRPAPSTPVLSALQVKTQLLALNRADAPWQVIDGQAEGVDLIAEWRIVDARWYEFFAKAGLKKAFRIYLRFDEASQQVRAKDFDYEVNWAAGVPQLSLSKKSTWGQSSSKEFGASYGLKEDLTLGEQYKFSFDSEKIKTPVQQAVLACGWVYKGVIFGRV